MGTAHVSEQAKTRDSSDRETELLEASSDTTSPERLQQLSKSKFVSVRVEVAANPSTPLHVLAELSEDRSHSVVDELTCRDDIPEWLMLKILGLYGTLLHQGVLKNNNLTPVIVDEIIALADNDTKILEKLATNPALPVEYITIFANHCELSVRKAVAMNVSTPQNVMLLLLADPSKEVRLSTIGHPSINGDQLTSLIEAARGEDRLELVLTGFVLNAVLNKNITDQHILHLADVFVLDKYIANMIIKTPACTDNMKVYLAVTFFGSYMKKPQYLKTFLSWKDLVVNFLKPMFPEITNVLPVVWLEQLLMDNLELLNPFKVAPAKPFLRKGQC